MKKTVTITFIFIFLVSLVRIDATFFKGGLNSLYTSKRITVNYTSETSDLSDEVLEAINRWEAVDKNTYDIIATKNKNADVIVQKHPARFAGQTVVGQMYPCKNTTSKKRDCGYQASLSSKWDFAYVRGYYLEMQEGGYTREDKIRTFTHEIGHAYSLGHPNNITTFCRKSIMCSGKTKPRAPTKSDKIELERKW